MIFKKCSSQGYIMIPLLSLPYIIAHFISGLPTFVKKKCTHSNYIECGQCTCGELADIILMK